MRRVEKLRKRYMHRIPNLYSLTLYVHMPKTSRLNNCPLTLPSYRRSDPCRAAAAEEHAGCPPPCRSGRLGDAARRLADGGAGAAAARLSGGQPLAEPA